MANTAQILKKIVKDHGNFIATRGDQVYEDVPRIPTGIFAIDLSMGGGFPASKCSEIFGPESSGKTNLVLLAIAQAQRMYPDKVCVFVDAEHALVRAWAGTLGVDLTRLIVIQPENAEQCVDFVESFMYADDVSVIALDSIAMLTKQSEIDNSATTMNVGGASLLVGKMYRMVTVAQTKMANAGLASPTFLAINQTRTKIGVMFGDPTTTPGGAAPRFASAMRLRVYGKNILVKKSDAMPTYKEVNTSVIKWKCPILAVNAVYRMRVTPGDGQPVGFIEDWNTVSSFMKELGYLAKGEKGGWMMGETLYSTLQDVREALYGDADALADMKATIIAELIETGGEATLAAQDDDTANAPAGTIDPETGEIT